MIERIKQAIRRYKEGPELILNARYRVVCAPRRHVRIETRFGGRRRAVEYPYRVEQYVTVPKITTRAPRRGRTKAWVPMGYHATRKQAAIHHNELASKPFRQEILS